MGSHQLHSEAAAARGGHWPFLDLLRFGAALIVLLGHTRSLLFVSFQDVAQAGFGTKLFYFTTGIHREGVAIFFAVSGFLVGGAALRALRQKRFDAKAYLASRFSRIYLVLLPALALALLLDEAGRLFLGETRFYGQRPLMPMGFTSDWTWPQMACNLAAVQGIFCKPLGINPPLWSLGFEWVFYLLAPVIFGLALWRLPKAIKVLAIAALFLGLRYFAGPFVHWLPWLAIWLAGALASQIVGQRSVPFVVALAGLGAIGAGFVVSRLQIVPAYGTDLVVGLGTALAITHQRLLSWNPLSRPIRIGADFSYSLYLIHVPVTVFLGGIVELYGWSSQLVAPGPQVYAVFAGFLIAALAISFLFAQATERHTDRMRRLLLGKRPPKMAPTANPA